jgi:hypothetical protein
LHQEITNSPLYKNAVQLQELDGIFHFVMPAGACAERSRSKRASPGLSCLPLSRHLHYPLPIGIVAGKSGLDSRSGICRSSSTTVISGATYSFLGVFDIRHSIVKAEVTTETLTAFFTASHKQAAFRFKLNNGHFWRAIDLFHFIVHCLHSCIYYFKTFLP